MRKYDCFTRKINLGKSLTPYPADLPIRKWGNILLIAKPRVGKSSIAKDVTVKVSKFRQVIIFDYGGEWSKHVTRYNWSSENPEKIIDAMLYKDFTFKLSQFNNASDFSSLGFSSDSCQFLEILINDGKGFYKDDLELFEELLLALPANNEMLEQFNLKYAQFNLQLPMRVNESTKNSLLTHWSFVKGWFWQGEGDYRKVYNWKDECFKQKHLIIDLTWKGNTNTNLAQAYCGKILELIRPHLRDLKPFIIFEECRFLAPNMGDNTWYVPSSLLQIKDLVTVLPKCDVSTMFIMQSENQVDKTLIEHYHTKVLGIVDRGFGKGDEYELAKRLRWVPDYPPPFGYREFLLWEANRAYSVFIPNITCCGV